MFAHLVDDTALGGDDEALFVRLDGVLQQGCGRADEIRDLDDGLFALRMGDDLRVGILFLQFYNLFEGELLVDVAGAVPEEHLAACDAVDVVAEVAVRTENDFRVFRQALDDLAGVGRCYHDVRYRLDSSCRIHIRDNRIARMSLYKLLKLSGGAAVGE